MGLTKLLLLWLSLAPAVVLSLHVSSAGTDAGDATQQLTETHAGSGPWDLKKVFRDEPPGAYLDLLMPLVYTAFLAYPTSAPDRLDSDSDWANGPSDTIWGKVYNASTRSLGRLAGSRNWQRLEAVEREPGSDGGPHMRAVVDREAKRAILAFRGACLNPKEKQCRNDMCATAVARAGNGVQRKVAESCQLVLKGIRKYVETAIEDVERAREHLGPDYAIMVTGHSLGGAIALSIDAFKKLNVQVVALEPTPYGNVIRNQLGLSDAQIKQLGTSDRYAIYDPIDLQSTSFGPLEELRPSTTVCVYQNVPLQEACTSCMKGHMQLSILGAEKALSQCLAGPADPKLFYSKCKDAVHFLDNYAHNLIPHSKIPWGAGLPKCQEVGVP